MIQSVHMPPQAPPVKRAGRGGGQRAPSGGITPQGNSCNCKGDQTYNKCQMSDNNCDPGFYPVCDCGAYNSSCTCTPVG